MNFIIAPSNAIQRFSCNVKVEIFYNKINTIFWASQQKTIAKPLWLKTMKKKINYISNKTHKYIIWGFTFKSASLVQYLLLNTSNILYLTTVLGILPKRRILSVRPLKLSFNLCHIKLISVSSWAILQILELIRYQKNTVPIPMRLTYESSRARCIRWIIINNSENI